jgi:hypothetical protein
VCARASLRVPVRLSCVLGGWCVRACARSRARARSAVAWPGWATSARRRQRSAPRRSPAAMACGRNPRPSIGRPGQERSNFHAQTFTIVLEADSKRQGGFKKTRLVPVPLHIWSVPKRRLGRATRFPSPVPSLDCQRSQINIGRNRGLTDKTIVLKSGKNGRDGHPIRCSGIGDNR